MIFNDMKHSLLTVMTVSAFLLTACSGNEVARTWASLPVSEETDAAQLAAEIKARPAEWKAAAEFLARPDLDTLPLGRYELTSKGTYANIQEYETRPVSEAKYEAHRAYTDIQVVLSGQENILIAPITAVKDLLVPFDEARDIEFFASATDFRTALADREHWVILFPSDAHAPCLSIGDEPVHIRKVVVKVIR